MGFCYADENWHETEPSNSLMLKWLLLPIILLTLIFSGLLVAGATAGRSVDTGVVAVIVDRSPMSRPPSSYLHFRLIDVRRRTAFITRPHLTDVQSAWLIGNTGRYAVIYAGNQQPGNRTQRLILYDLTTGEQIILNEVRKAHGYFIWDDYDLSLSPDQARAAFVHPVTHDLWIHDIPTGQRRVIVSLGNQVDDPVWSPDSTQLALKAGSDLVILDAAPEEMRRYPQEIDHFVPRWSDNGHQILLQTTVTSGPLLRMIDADTGKVNPYTAYFTGYSAAIGCEGTRKAHIGNVMGLIASGQNANVADLNKKRVVIMDLLTGAETEVTALSEIDDLDPIIVQWLPDCQGLVVDATLPSAEAVISGLIRVLWLVEPDGSAARLIAEQAWAITIEPDGSLIYQTSDQNNTNHLYRLRSDGTTELLGLLPKIRGAPASIDDSGWVLFHQAFSSGTNPNQPLIVWLDGSDPQPLVSASDIVLSYAVLR